MARTYRMAARADASAETARRIVAAFAELAQERGSLRVTLDEVAARAGTSVPTILRHHGSRDGLVDAAIAFVTAEVEAERAAPVGAVAEALAALLDHYESRGDMMAAFLRQEVDDPRIRRAITGPGRALHRRWVAAIFAPWLSASTDEELTDLLVVATDLQTWRILRRDRQLDREQTERRMLRLVEALLAGVPTTNPDGSR